ncbi:ROK family protein [Knoellia sp. CPCC 206453]|uniref:ROK family transcriptional regulator n=1 Tax=Knoellia pratensis TaxID=3404796 RepID=UPI003622A950
MGAPSSDQQGLMLIFRLVRHEQARSRADLSRLTGLSRSTVSARVDTLIRRGLLTEDGEGVSTGGRRPQRLRIVPGQMHVIAIHVRRHHTRVLVTDGSARPVRDHRVEGGVLAGPDRVLAAVTEVVRRHASPPVVIGAACIAVPGPVTSERGILGAPARMAGWAGADLAAMTQEQLGVETLVENDANALAVGASLRLPSAQRNLLAVFAGQGIGCGLVINGELFRGSTGLAGEIGHATVMGAPPIACSCGHQGCLDAVASGAALVVEARQRGLAVAGKSDLIALAADGDPTATNLLRVAGERVGAVLASMVSFFNPGGVLVAGALARSTVFFSSVTGALYAHALSGATEQLEVSRTLDESALTAVGAAEIALRHAYREPGAHHLMG